MCRHILNCQTYVQSPCCNKWYECSECHDEAEEHVFKYDKMLKFTCKPCKGVFLRDFTLFSESDKRCNFCGNLWVLPSVTPESKIYEESLTYIEGCFHAHLDPTNHYFNETHDTSVENEKK